MSIIDVLREECGYDDERDGSVDELIAYKDALEDVVARAEELLAENRKGQLSAADVTGGLWEIGFDPDPPKPCHYDDRRASLDRPTPCDCGCGR